MRRGNIVLLLSFSIFGKKVIIDNQTNRKKKLLLIIKQVQETISSNSHAFRWKLKLQTYICFQPLPTVRFMLIKKLFTYSSLAKHKFFLNPILENIKYMFFFYIYIYLLKILYKCKLEFSYINFVTFYSISKYINN